MAGDSSCLKNWVWNFQLAITAPHSRIPTTLTGLLSHYHFCTPAVSNKPFTMPWTLTLFTCLGSFSWSVSARTHYPHIALDFESLLILRSPCQTPGSLSNLFWSLHLDLFSLHIVQNIPKYYVCASMFQNLQTKGLMLEFSW